MQVEYGIGAVAYHTFPDNTIKAFYHVSRRLTSSECNYSQVETEGLGIVFGITKFHKYIWGRKFSLLTDHRPLLAIFSPTKGIPQHTANRLQRWALILMAYDFKISFVRTEDFGHADVLSRLIADRPPEDFVVAAAREDEKVNQFLTDSNYRGMPVKFADIGRTTDEHCDLQMVKYYLCNGWPPSTSVVCGGAVKMKK